MKSDDKSLSLDSFRKILETTFLVRWEKNAVLEISGAEAVDLLHRLSTNDVLGIVPGGTVGTCFLTEKGRLIDYVNILVMTGKAILLPSPGNAAGFSQWIDRFIIMEDVAIIDRSNEVFGYSVIGPDAGEVVFRTLGVHPKSWQHSEAVVDGEAVLVSHRGLLESDRFDLLVPQRVHNRVEVLLADLTQHDPSVLELLRIWKGIAGFDKEISEYYNPYETGFAAFLNDRKGCYVGQEVMARLATYGKVQKTLTGVLLSRRPAEGDTLELYLEGSAIGLLTSIPEISVAGYYPGLAIIRRNAVEPGNNPGLSPDGGGPVGLIASLPFTTDFLTTLPEPLSRTSERMAR